MKNNGIEGKIAEITKRDSRYEIEAYKFIERAVKLEVAKSLETQSPRHITAKELLGRSIRLAEKEYGPFAESVLRGWGINSASDIGNIVYSLIKVKALSASDEDSPDDFCIEYDLFSRLRKESHTMPKHEIEVPVIA